VISTRPSRARFGGGVALALAVLATFVVRYAGDALVMSEHVGEPDAIVVLASHEWERLPVAADIARQYPAARVVLTQPAEVTEHNCFDCSTRVNRLTAAGVNRDRVTVLPQGVTNTYDEAKAAAAFVGREHVDRVVVVTSPYHGRRALATFRHLFKSAGVEAHVGLASPSSHADPRRWWLRSYDREYVAYEWAGIVYYAIRFGVPPVV
jgi:uncharacterized SAM-binding protein YcdF (DUF218 family)